MKEKFSDAAALQKVRLMALSGLILYSILYFAAISVQTGDHLVLVSDVMSPIGIGASFLIMVYAISQHSDRQMRTLWMIFSVGTLSLFLGDVAWFYYEIIRNVSPYPSIADVFYGLQSILFVCGLFYLGIKQRLLKQIVSSMDILIGVTLLFILELKYVIVPIFSSNILLGYSAFVSILYPLSDIIMMVLVITIAFGPKKGTMVRINRLILLPIGIFIVIDQIYCIETIYSTYASGKGLDPLWPISVWILSLVSLFSAKISKNNKTTMNGISEPQAIVSKSQNIFAVIVFISTIFFLVYVFKACFVLDILSVGLTVLVILVILRQIMAYLEVRNLILMMNQTNEELRLANEKLDIEAKMDYLTGLYNRRHIMSVLASLKEYIQVNNTVLSVIVIDIDFFKKVNDTYGHECGDEVLRMLSKLLINNTREHDLVGRLGGEEFIILLPNTDTEHAQHLCERIRQKVSSTPFCLDHSSDCISITISAGISCLNQNSSMDTDIIKEADQALYVAKNSGRNCVCCYPSHCITPMATE